MITVHLRVTFHSVVSEHASEIQGHIPVWNQVKFIDLVPHWYTSTVKDDHDEHGPEILRLICHHEH